MAESKRADARADARRANLGRGLSALFGDANEDYASLDKVRQTKQVPIEFLKPGPFQPRRLFDEEAINGLVESIKEKGILQPLLVRRDPADANTYQIICGERRWRAAQIAGLHELPIVLRDLGDREALEVSLIENIQRQDLSPLEEAEGYKRLLEEFDHTQEAVGRIVGKSRSHVANMLRLLSLPDGIKKHLHDGSLSAGHARALLTAGDPAALADSIVKQGLNVRQTEQLVRSETEPAAIKKDVARLVKTKDADIQALEKQVSSRLGLKVAIAPKGKGGTVTIRYTSLDQLDEVLGRLGGDDH